MYFNDGLYFSGESLNPPVTAEILSEIKYKGLQTIQRIDRANDIWRTVDEKEPIEQYQRNEFGTFIPLLWREFDTIQDKKVQGMDRYHSGFGKIIEDEKLRAVAIFDSELIQGNIGNTFAYEFPEIKERTHKISELIEFEKIRAEKVYQMTYVEYKRR